MRTGHVNDHVVELQAADLRDAQPAAAGQADNDEISLCDALITIPTARLPQIKDTEIKASSLNLGQAVLLLGYEWLKSADATPASRTRATAAVPASRQELVDLFEHLETELDAGGFFFPPAKKGAMVRNIRAMILRSGLTDQQARTIRGMIVALVVDATVSMSVASFR